MQKPPTASAGGGLDAAELLSPVSGFDSRAHVVADNSRSGNTHDGTRRGNEKAGVCVVNHGVD